MTESGHNILYTIGHSNHTIENFVDLLKRYEIEVVADVRSAPYSRYCPQFNKDVLAARLEAAGVGYMFFGGELGARPDDSLCYENGRVNLQLVAERKEFRDGLRKLLTESSRCCVALMCAEKDPLECHRTILVCRFLKGDGFRIKHILGDGSIEDHCEAERRLVKMLKIEPTLFESSNKERDFIKQAYDRQAQKIS